MGTTALLGSPTPLSDREHPSAERRRIGRFFASNEVDYAQCAVPPAKASTLYCRWVSPSPGWMGGQGSSNQSPADPARAAAGQYRSPLRAHAPAFVPSALQSVQGKKAEIH